MSQSLVNIPDLLAQSLSAGKPIVEWAELLLEYGQDFPTPNNSGCIGYIPDLSGKCFQTAFNACRLAEGVLYAEGLAYMSPEHLGRAPLWHAWNILPNGAVFDQTWHHSHRVEYFGITFDYQWMEENTHPECSSVFGLKWWPRHEKAVREYLASRTV